MIQPGSNQTTTYTYASGRVARILAPVPTGSSCPAHPSTFSGATHMGCRALDLTYATVNGNQQLTAATEQTTDGTGATKTVALACYAYDTNGRLSQAWDPRINSTSCTSSPATSDLPTAYGYDGSGRLSSITPPGVAAWTLAYDGNGKFSTASRQHSGSWGTGTETGTVVYDVPLGNDANAATGYHPDLSAGTAATWAQTDLPTTATAVYNPGDNIGTGSGGDYRDGVIHALNVAGREVNTATYSGTGQAGWKIDTTEHDDDGHVLRTLDAANRDRALRRADMPAVSVDLPASTIAAGAICLTPGVNIFGCGFATAGAYAIRAQQRGYRNYKANAIDFGVTYLSFGTAAAGSYGAKALLRRGHRGIAKGALAAPGFVGDYAGYGAAHRRKRSHR